MEICTCESHLRPRSIILEAASFLDRPERSRDLADLAHLIELAVGLDDPDRWSDEVLDRDLEFELAGPFLLGRRVSALAKHAERDVVEALLRRLEGPEDRSSTLGRILLGGPHAWREESVARGRLEAFRRGFAS